MFFNQLIRFIFEVKYKQFSIGMPHFLAFQTDQFFEILSLLFTGQSPFFQDHVPPY